VLLWRQINVVVAVVVGATAVWFIFGRAGYNFLSVLANALLLLVTILFFWAKYASILNMLGYSVNLT
jgi:reticulon-3